MHNWTFEEIGRMTRYRALVALGANCPEDITYTEKAG